MVLVVLVVGLIVLIVWTDLTYKWSTYSSFMSAPTPEQILERQKTIWDWLQLLIIPIVIALSAMAFGWMERRNEQVIASERVRQEWKIADERLKEDHRIAGERAQDAALETYIGQMSTLLLDRNLYTSDATDEVRAVARTLTLTILQRLSGDRKGVVLQFLYESGLITGNKSMLSLASANLENVNLVGTNLVGANLGYANLKDANLGLANLENANLVGANLRLANLRGTSLRDANYSEQTRWPAGFDPVATGAILVRDTGYNRVDNTQIAYR